jgi:hypothetical protein
MSENNEISLQDFPHLLNLYTNFFDLKCSLSDCYDLSNLHTDCADSMNFWMDCSDEMSLINNYL